MSGTKAGGIAARDKNIQLHGPDYYQKLGKLGGQQGTGHKFAHGKVSPSTAGKLGGRGRARQRTP
jgi:general stress protein YciG